MVQSMGKKYIYIGLVIIVAVGIFVAVNFRKDESVSAPQAEVSDSNQDIVKFDEPTLREGGEGSKDEGEIFPVSIQAMQRKDYDGRDLTLGKVLAENESYTRYYITYMSGQFKVSGIMNVPKGKGPFPVLILNHGYIDPAIYTNGRGLRREQDYLARQGFVVIHIDYRNHADSDKDPDNDINIRIGYVEDAINAVYAVKESGLPYFAKDKIGMLGHSMGGGVSQAVMVVQPELVDAFVLYAPVSMDVRDSFERWTRTRPEVAQKIIELFGEPKDNPKFWDNISPSTFIKEVKSPAMIFHGTADADVPIEWSRRTRDSLVSVGKSVELVEYPGQPHEFTTTHTDFMRRSTEFFRTNLE